MRLTSDFVMVIEESMRRHAQDQPERKGSELNDTHLRSRSSVGARPVLPLSGTRLLTIEWE